MKSLLLYFKVSTLLLTSGTKDTVGYVKVYNYQPNYSRCYIYRDSITAQPAPWQHLYLNALGLDEEAFDRNKDNWYDSPGDCRDSVAQIARRENAVEAIAKAAQKYRIVMINEDHSQPQDRMFTILLAKELKKEGFDYFGAEGIEYRDTVLEKHSIPNVATGNYTAEPTYGNLLRTYMQNGYHIFQYDIYSDTTFSERWDTLPRGYKKRTYRTSSMGDGYQIYDSLGKVTPEGRYNFEKRDSVMAFNIYRLVKSHPDSKFLIHVGFGHLQKDETFMGSILRNLMKEDFLAIDQIAFLEPPHGITSRVYDSLVTTEPVVYQLKSKNYLSFYPKAIDMCVVLPKIKYIHGKPDWMLWNKDREIKPMPEITKAVVHYPTIVKVYLDSEYKIAGDHAAPIDVVFFENENDKKEKWFSVPKQGPLRVVVSSEGEKNREMILK